MCSWKRNPQGVSDCSSDSGGTERHYEGCQCNWYVYAIHVNPRQVVTDGAAILQIDFLWPPRPYKYHPSGSALICQSLCQAVKDVVLLFCTMIPTLHSDQLQVPQISMLFCNDCHYLGDQLLLLPHTITMRSEPHFSTKEISFVHQTFRFRSSAKKVMDKQVIHIYPEPQNKSQRISVSQKLEKTV